MDFCKRCEKQFEKLDKENCQDCSDIMSIEEQLVILEKRKIFLERELKHLKSQ